MEEKKEYKIRIVFNIASYDYLEYFMFRENDNIFDMENYVIEWVKKFGDKYGEFEFYNIYELEDKVWVLKM